MYIYIILYIYIVCMCIYIYIYSVVYIYIQLHKCTCLQVHIGQSKNSSLFPGFEPCSALEGGGQRWTEYQVMSKIRQRMVDLPRQYEDTVGYTGTYNQYDFWVCPKLRGFTPMPWALLVGKWYSTQVICWFLHPWDFESQLTKMVGL